MGVNDVQSETDVSQKGKGAHLQNAEFAANTLKLKYIDINYYSFGGVYITLVPLHLSGSHSKPLSFRHKNVALYHQLVF